MLTRSLIRLSELSIIMVLERVSGYYTVSPEKRSAILFLFNGGSNSAGIAAALDLDAKTVQSVISKARKQGKTVR